MFWDPPREVFIIPCLNRPLAWYGVLFALGVWLAFQVTLAIYRGALMRSSVDIDRKEAKIQAAKFCERLSLYVIIGTVLGAKIGHVLFYEPWSMIRSDPMMLIRVWEEGLASHGAVLGIIIALLLFAQKTQVKLIQLIDYLAIPACIAATFIRLGNFINQEILGKVTGMPWGVTFGHPVDGSWPVPRHPVQLYEAAFYALSALIITIVWRKRPKTGMCAGLLFVLVFGFRFLVEFLKEAQSALIDAGAWLTMGQWLSLPFIALGACCIWQYKGGATGRGADKRSRVDGHEPSK